MRTLLRPGGFRAGVVVVVVVVGLSSVVGACSEQLGQSQFDTPCAQTDVDCVGVSDDGGARAPVAVGAHFDLVVTPQLAGALSVPLHFRPVDAAVVGLSDGVLVAGKPGLTAVLLLTDSDEVVDVVHVAVQKPERLTLHRSLQDGAVVVDERPLPERIEVFPNEELTLRLNVWSGAQALDGDTDDAWTTSNPEFRIIHQGFARERRLRAPATGATDVVVALATGLSTTVRFEVIP